MIRLFVDRLTVVDASYLHPQRGLLGASWLCDLELAGELDAQGMVLDFGDVKRDVKRLIDERFDHKLIVPLGHAGLRIDDVAGRLRVRFDYGDGRRVSHAGPPDATCLVEAAEITPQVLGAAIADALRATLPANVTGIAVALREEPSTGASYRYSHGLRQHAGNCQRIAHGHRSRIEIFRDGRRDAALEEEWAAHWRDVYIGTRSDLIATIETGGLSYHRFGYAGSQGEFELELPAEACYLIDTDSTVENIAQHVAAQLAQERPGARYRVRAFEGVDKGAVAEA